ncbi:MAG: O-antigen ligase family protein [Planctomycetes bacterium]|nr:O-antigen ligase family protein [Planctomycetota bacterium]
MASHPMTLNPRLMRAAVRPPRSVRVSPIGYILLLGLLAFCALNLGIVLKQVYPSLLPETPINPLVVALFFPPIFLLSNTRQRSVYFLAAWFFWMVYTLGGFGGSTPITDYVLAQRVFKIWITIIAIPWLAIRTVPVEKVPQVTKFVYLLVCVGAIVAIAQVLSPGIADVLNARSSEQRGAGFWDNPNNCGAICGIGVFLSMMYPLRSRTLNYTVRLILLGGLLASLSRSSILTFGVCCLIYGLTTKNFLVIVRVLVVMLVMAVVGITSLSYLKATASPVAQRRISKVMDSIRGQVSSEDIQGSRLVFWKASFDQIKTNWFRGLGHGQTKFRVHGHENLKATHNYYLEVWANSGFLALLAFLMLLAIMAITALRCRDMTIRAGMCALIATIAMLSMVNNGLMAFQPMGAFIGLFALIGFANKKQREPLMMAPPMRRLRPLRPMR